MDVQLIRENIRLEQPLGTGSAQALVTGEVTLPGGLREETHVLSAQATAAVERAEAAQGRVNVRGRVVFHVLYTQGDPSRVNAIEATADFTQSVDLPGAIPRAVAEAQAQLTRVEARASGGRLSLRAEAEVNARASSLQPVDAVMAIDGTDDVQVRTIPQVIRRTVASGSADVLLREELELPAELQIRETLCATAWPVVEAVTGGVGRSGLSGQVLLEAVHASDLPGRPVVVTRHSIPFTQSVELVGEDGEELDGWVTVRDVAVASQDDDAGMFMRAEILLGLEGRADVQETLSVLTDAYTTTGDALQLTGGTVMARTGGKRLAAAESCKATLLLPDSAPPLRTSLAAFVRPQLTQTENAGDRTTLSGMLDVTLLYMTDGSAAPVSLQLSEPFRVTFACSLPQGALVHLAVTEAEAVPVTSDRVELRCILRLQSAGLEQQAIPLVTEGRCVPADEPTQAIVLYYVQPGEGLWEVAKRYRTPMETLRVLNPSIAGDVQPGQGVIVWRRSGK